MVESIDLKSVKWRSRRGMLELDLILQPFIDKVFATLSLEMQNLYWQFLEEEDQDLWRWLLKIEQAPEVYHELINYVRNI